MIIRTAWRYRLLFVLILAILLRLIIFFVFPKVFNFVETGAIHGSGSYDAYAQNLLATGIYGFTPGQADALIPPLYSYLLAGLYGLFGRGALQVALLHILLDCFSIAFVYDIARRLMPHGDLVGTLAGLMVAFYPYLIFQNLTVIDTPFFMTQLYAFMWLMALLRSRPAFDSRGWLLAIAGGIVLGLGMLTRPILPPFALLVGVWFLLRLNAWQTFVRLLPVAMIGGLILVPWIARNYDVYGAFVPMTVTSGSNLWQGNNRYVIPYFRAGYDVQWTSPDPEEIDNLDPQTREADAMRFQLALDFWRENPDKLVELFGLKFLVHWSIDIAPRLNPTEGELPRVDYQGNIVIEQGDDGELRLTDLPPGDPVGAYSQPLFDQLGRAVHIIYWGSLFVLGCVGIGLTWRHWRDVSLLWFVQIAMTLVYVVFHPSTRYRVPTDPAWFIFSAAALVSLYLWLRNRPSRAQAAHAT